MRIVDIRRALALAFVAVLASCGGGGSPPMPPPAQGVPPGSSFSVEGFPATFTEFNTPSGITPVDMTIGPDASTPWFGNFHLFNSSTIAGGFVTSSGAIHLVTLPTISENGISSVQLFSGSGAVASVSGNLWTVATDPAREDESLLMQITPSGTATVKADLGVCCGSPVNKMIAGPDGNLWLAVCQESCSEFSAIVESVSLNGKPPASVRLGDVSMGITYSANSIASGPDGNVYATATYTGVPGEPVPDSSVFKISTSGTILAQYPLASGSAPIGIVTGPDKNLWIAESGTGRIARMTTGGSVAEFALASSTAGPQMITVGTDGALWFTESPGNALGRITTSGQISQFAIPTANSNPFGVASPAQCNAHGLIWFAEQIGKVGKFEF
jgi:hypothetical protein